MSKYLQGHLEFVKDIYRKNAENQLLDLKNPLGVPVDAPMLLFLLNFKDKFLVEYSVKYGNVNMLRVLDQHQNCKATKRGHKRRWGKEMQVCVVWDEHSKANPKGGE